MSARSQGLMLIALLLCLSFVFQLQLKIFADQIAPLVAKPDQELGSKLRTLIHVALSWRFGIIAVLASLLFLVWLMTLTRLELSLALPLASIAIVVNAVGAGLMLGETMTPTRIAGVIVMAVGIALVLRT